MLHGARVIVIEHTRGFALCVQCIHNVVVVYSTPKSSRLAICGDGDFLQLAKVDLYAVFHGAQCLRGPVAAVDGEKIDVVFPGEFDLESL